MWTLNRRARDHPSPSDWAGPQLSLASVGRGHPWRGAGGNINLETRRQAQCGSRRAKTDPMWVSLARASFVGVNQCSSIGTTWLHSHGCCTVQMYSEKVREGMKRVFSLTRSWLGKIFAHFKKSTWYLLPSIQICHNLHFGEKCAYAKRL